MRMRKKKYLEQRLDSVGRYAVDLAVVPKDHRQLSDITAYIDQEALYGRVAPLHLEIGCGKGGFVTEMAGRMPEADFLAVERISNVLVAAMENAAERRVPNVRFMLTGAEYLSAYIPPHSISRIYLNFSTPLPKNGYEQQRLTSIKMLELYKTLMACGAEIWQKTDSEEFFEYSYANYLSCGYEVYMVSRDWHRDARRGSDDVVTEYERRYSDMGKPIYAVRARYIGAHGQI